MVAIYVIKNITKSTNGRNYYYLAGHQNYGDFAFAEFSVFTQQGDAEAMFAELKTTHPREMLQIQLWYISRRETIVIRK